MKRGGWTQVRTVAAGTASVLLLFVLGPATAALAAVPIDDDCYDQPGGCPSIDDTLNWLLPIVAVVGGLIAIVAVPIWIWFTVSDGFRAVKDKRDPSRVRAREGASTKVLSATASTDELTAP